MVKITLPNPNDFQYEGGIKHFLRQLELCVHHAQKAYEEIKQSKGEEDCCAIFRQPKMDFHEIRETQKDLPCYRNYAIQIHVDKQYDEGQEIVLEINN